MRIQKRERRTGASEREDETVSADERLAENDGSRGAVDSR
jgi:hypothetical protein